MESFALNPWCFLGKMDVTKGTAGPDSSSNLSGSKTGGAASGAASGLAVPGPTRSSQPKNKGEGSPGQIPPSLPLTENEKRGRALFQRESVFGTFVNNLQDVRAAAADL